MTNPHPVEGQQALAERLREMDAKATPGPWSGEEPMGPNEVVIVEANQSTDKWRFIATVNVVDREFRRGQPRANVALIVALRNALPEILAALERGNLEAEVDRQDAEIADLERRVAALSPVDAGVDGQAQDLLNEAVRFLRNEDYGRFASKLERVVGAALRSSSEQHQGDGGDRYANERARIVAEELLEDTPLDLTEPEVEALFAKYVELLTPWLSYPGAAADTPAPEPGEDGEEELLARLGAALIRERQDYAAITDLQSALRSANQAREKAEERVAFLERVEAHLLDRIASLEAAK